ncbi:hypothetical protein FQN55_008287 [Onygenales sp. PD_40]|nr:hypothetical protein FQN55_008287 [Onygenales sp. PD_40]
MALGEYIRGKALQNEPPAFQGVGEVAPRPLRERVADMARVKVPITRLNGGHTPQGGRGVDGQDDRGQAADQSSGGNGSRYQSQSNGHPRHKDVFDTDVEGIDDSTTTATSLTRGEEGREPELQSFPSNQFASRDDEGGVLGNAGYGQGGSVAPNSLAERMVMEVGSDPEDDGDDMQHQNHHHMQRDDGGEAEDEDDYGQEVTQIFDWSSTNATNGEPLSWQKIEAALRDNGKRPPTPAPLQDLQQENIDPNAGLQQLEHDSYPTNQYPPKATQKYATGGRFVTRSRFATPNIRETTPHEGRLVGARVAPQTSPIRTAPLSPLSPSHPESTMGAQSHHPNPLHAPHDEDDGYNPSGLFDITDLSAIDSSSSSESTSIQQTYTSLRLSTLSPISSRRPITAISSDYPPNILETKSFADLRAESFDYNPAPPQPIFQPQDPPLPLPEKLNRLKALTSDQRENFFTSLSLAEWEDSGDWLIEEFGVLLKKTKEARIERRKVAAVFEREIERRYEGVQAEGEGIGQRLEEMRTGGLGVLKGRLP